jgi:hypothetical protein
MTNQSYRAKKRAAARKRERQKAPEHQRADLQESKENDPPSAESSAERNQSPPSVQVAPKVIPTPKGDRIKDQCKPDQTPQWKMVLEVSAFLLGLIFARTYYGQWQAAEGQLKAAQANFKQSQRPWLGPNFKSPVFRFNDQGSGVAYTFTLHNYGQSPAIASKVRTSITVQPGDTDWNHIQAKMDAVITDSSRPMTIFGGQDMPIAGPTNYPNGSATNNVLPLLDPHALELIAQEEVRIIVYGKVSYGDEFGEDHITTYCVFYMPRNIDPSQSGGWSGCPVKTTAD